MWDLLTNTFNLYLNLVASGHKGFKKGLFTSDTVNFKGSTKQTFKKYLLNTIVVDWLI